MTEPDLDTPTGEVVHVGAIDVVLVSDASFTKVFAAAIEEAKEGAGTTEMIPGPRQRYSVVIDEEAGLYGISVHR